MHLYSFCTVKILNVFTKRHYGFVGSDYLDRTQYELADFPIRFGGLDHARCRAWKTG
jgi:hypothetical protein